MTYLTLCEVKVYGKKVPAKKCSHNADCPCGEKCPGANKTCLPDAKCHNCGANSNCEKKETKKKKTCGTFSVTNKAVQHFPKWAASTGAKLLSADFNNDGKTDLALTGPHGW